MKNLLISFALIVTANSTAFAYTLVDLGTNIEPLAINNAGIVVGISNTDQFPPTAFRWSSDNGVEVIAGINARAVNDNGQIVGNTISSAFILDGVQYSDWPGFSAFGNNLSGMVAGYKVGTNPYQPRSLPYNPAVFDGQDWHIFDIAEIYPRGTRDGVYADRFILNGINMNGYSVGYHYRYGLAGSNSILIDTNDPVNSKADVIFLPTPAGGKAADINSNNMIVGTTGSNTQTTPVIYRQAYLLDYNSTSLTILPLLDGGLRSSANDINEYNQVVGTSEMLVNGTTVNHAFLWRQADGVTLDLNDWAGPGWVFTEATAINDNGDIVGKGFLNGVEHGFLLTNGTIAIPAPVVPEPTPTPNLMPQAVASADVYAGKAPLRVNFDSSGSADPDGTIISYYWDFMDGSTSTDANPSHRFTDPGSYAVTLTVTDDQGMSASNSITITVTKSNGKKK